MNNKYYILFLPPLKLILFFFRVGGYIGISFLITLVTVVITLLVIALCVRRGYLPIFTILQCILPRHAPHNRRRNQAQAQADPEAAIPVQPIYNEPPNAPHNKRRKQAQAQVDLEAAIPLQPIYDDPPNNTRISNPNFEFVRAQQSPLKINSDYEIGEASGTSVREPEDGVVLEKAPTQYSAQGDLYSSPVDDGDQLAPISGGKLDESAGQKGGKSKELLNQKTGLTKVCAKCSRKLKDGKIVQTRCTCNLTK